MKPNILLILLFILVAATFAFSQEEDEPAAVHKIDAAQLECLKVSKGTMPRAECYNTAAKAWDEDLAKTYAALLAKTTKPADRKALQDSESAWEKYRDAEFAYLAALYNDKKGTGYIAVRIVQRMKIVKNRALMLESRLESIGGE